MAYTHQVPLHSSAMYSNIDVNRYWYASFPKRVTLASAISFRLLQLCAIRLICFYIGTTQCACAVLISARGCIVWRCYDANKVTTAPTTPASV